MNQSTLNLRVVPGAGSDPGLPGPQATGLALELAFGPRQVHLSIYRRTDTPALGISDYLLCQRELPFAVRARPYYALKGPSGLFVPLEDFLLVLYQEKRISCPITQVVSELRAWLPLSAAAIPGGVEPRPIFQPPITQEGFYLLETRAYGHRLKVLVGWFCPPDRARPGAAPCFPAGAIQFRALPNYNLSSGRWETSDRPVSRLLQQHLRTTWPGSPLELLSEAGRQRIIETFPWTFLELMSKKEARRARVEFVRAHPQLRDKPTELASALMAAGLYSPTCNAREIAAYVGSLVAEAFGGQSGPGAG